MYFPKMNHKKINPYTVISRGLYIFYPIVRCGLYCRAVNITDNLCTKKGNSSNFGPKIRALYLRAVNNMSFFFNIYKVENVKGGEYVIKKAKNVVT